MKRSIHAERVAHRNTLRLLCPDGHAPLTLSLAMTQLILHTHLFMAGILLFMTSIAKEASAKPQLQKNPALGR